MWHLSIASNEVITSKTNYFDPQKILSLLFFYVYTQNLAPINLRSGVPFSSRSVFYPGGKECLIQLLNYLSVASPESGLFSDWSRNKGT